MAEPEFNDDGTVYQPPFPETRIQLIAPNVSKSKTLSAKTATGATSSPPAAAISRNGLPISSLGSKSANVDKIVLKDISTSTDALFYDKVETNKKYYYVMRFLNERGEPGHFSSIYCAELIDDGGYLYPKFDTIFPKDLEADKKSINTTKDFKKLFNLVPNIQQLLLDDGDVDYSKPANSQKEKIKVGLVEHQIWDKTFKIRLTSKKTGKKIDLNITYELSR